MKKRQKRPNIVWIVTDHQGQANRVVSPGQRPLQDYLAKTGVSFERAYSVLPICSPARASMITGLFPHAHGLTENDGRFGGRAELDHSDWMIQQAFLEEGYRCGWFGKWHLSQDRSALDFGFEGYSLSGYGYPYASKTYLDYLRRNSLPDPIVEIELPGESGVKAGTQLNLLNESSWFDYEAGTAILKAPAETHEAFFLTDLASTWINDLGDEPFFLRLDPWGPHPPYIVDETFASLPETGFSTNFNYDLSGRPEHHKDYLAYWTQTLQFDETQWALMAQRAMDHGKLIETALHKFVLALEKKGLSENTLFVFCADHGDAVGSNGGVSNKGGLMVEETMQIPLAMKGPGLAVEARTELCSNLDLAPTLLDFCNVKTNVELHGSSLCPLLHDSKEWHRLGIMAQHYGLHVPITQRACYAGDWKYVRQHDGFEELYNLANDPSELANLAKSKDHSTKRNELCCLLMDEMKRVGDYPANFSMPV
jgi:arylsulfatase A-like enzyme